MRIKITVVMMSDNELLAVLCTSCVVLLVALKFLKEKIGVHLLVFLSYTLSLFYGLIFKGDDGTSIVWFVSLVFCYAIHLIVMIIRVITILYRRIARHEKNIG